MEQLYKTQSVDNYGKQKYGPKTQRQQKVSELPKRAGEIRINEDLSQAGYPGPNERSKNQTVTSNMKVQDEMSITCKLNQSSLSQVKHENIQQYPTAAAVGVTVVGPKEDKSRGSSNLQPNTHFALKKYGADTRMTKGTYVRLTSLERQKRQQPKNITRNVPRLTTADSIFDNQNLQPLYQTQKTVPERQMVKNVSFSNQDTMTTKNNGNVRQNKSNEMKIENQDQVSLDILHQKSQETVYSSNHTSRQGLYNGRESIQLKHHKSQDSSLSNEEIDEQILLKSMQLQMQEEIKGEKKFMPIVQTKFNPQLGTKKQSSVASPTLQNRNFLEYTIKRNSIPGHGGRKHQIKLKEYDIGSPITPIATTAGAGQKHPKFTPINANNIASGYNSITPVTPTTQLASRKFSLQTPNVDSRHQQPHQYPTAREFDNIFGGHTRQPVLSPKRMNMDLMSSRHSPPQTAITNKRYFSNDKNTTPKLANRQQQSNVGEAQLDSPKFARKYGHPFLKTKTYQLRRLAPSHQVPLAAERHVEPSSQIFDTQIGQQSTDSCGGKIALKFTENARIKIGGTSYRLSSLLDKQISSLRETSEQPASPILVQQAQLASSVENLVGQRQENARRQYNEVSDRRKEKFHQAIEASKANNIYARVNQKIQLGHLDQALVGVIETDHGQPIDLRLKEPPPQQRRTRQSPVRADVAPEVPTRTGSFAQIVNQSEHAKHESPVSIGTQSHEDHFGEVGNAAGQVDANAYDMGEDNMRSGDDADAVDQQDMDSEQYADRHEDSDQDSGDGRGGTRRRSKYDVNSNDMNSQGVETVDMVQQNSTHKLVPDTHEAFVLNSETGGSRSQRSFRSFGSRRSSHQMQKLNLCHQISDRKASQQTKTSVIKKLSEHRPALSQLQTGSPSPGHDSTLEGPKYIQSSQFARQACTAEQNYGAGLHGRGLPDSTLDGGALRHVTTSSSQFSGSNIEEGYAAQPSNTCIRDESFENQGIQRPGQLSIQVNQRKQDRDEKQLNMSREASLLSTSEASVRDPRFAFDQKQGTLRITTQIPHPRRDTTSPQKIRIVPITATAASLAPVTQFVAQSKDTAKRAEPNASSKMSYKANSSQYTSLKVKQFAFGPQRQNVQYLGTKPRKISSPSGEIHQSNVINGQAVPRLTSLKDHFGVIPVIGGKQMSPRRDTSKSRRFASSGDSQDTSLQLNSNQKLKSGRSSNGGQDSKSSKPTHEQSKANHKILNLTIGGGLSFLKSHLNQESYLKENQTEPNITDTERSEGVGSERGGGQSAVAYVLGSQTTSLRTGQPLHGLTLDERNLPRLDTFDLDLKHCSKAETPSTSSKPPSASVPNQYHAKMTTQTPKNKNLPRFIEISTGYEQAVLPSTSKRKRSAIKADRYKEGSKDHTAQPHPGLPYNDCNTAEDPQDSLPKMRDQGTGVTTGADGLPANTVEVAINGIKQQALEQDSQASLTRALKFVQSKQQIVLQKLSQQARMQANSSNVPSTLMPESPKTRQRLGQFYMSGMSGASGIEDIAAKTPVKKKRASLLLYDTIHMKGSNQQSTVRPLIALYNSGSEQSSEPIMTAPDPNRKVAHKKVSKRPAIYATSTSPHGKQNLTAARYQVTERIGNFSGGVNFTSAEKVPPKFRRASLAVVQDLALAAQPRRTFQLPNVGNLRQQSSVSSPKAIALLKHSNF